MMEKRCLNNSKAYISINDLEEAIAVNINKDFIPPNMYAYLDSLQKKSGLDFYNLKLVAYNSLFFISGPRHIKLRKKVLSLLSKKAINLWIPHFEKSIEQALLNLKTSSDPDLVRDFSYPLFNLTTQQFFGIKPNEPAKFNYWTQQIQTLLQPLLPLRELKRMEIAFKEMLDQLRNAELLEESPVPKPLIYDLLEFQMEDYGNEDALALLIVLYGASINFAQTLTNIVWHILTGPVALKVRAQDPIWVEQNLEYLIKIGASVRYIRSIAQEDVVVAGHSFKKGDLASIDLLELHTGGCPFKDDKKWNAEGLTSNKHLAFGKGVHFCVGAYQSRLLISLTLPKLFSYFPQLAKSETAVDINQDKKEAVILESLKVNLNSI